MTEKMEKIVITILLIAAAIAAAAFLLFSNNPGSQTASLSDSLVLGNDFKVYRSEKYEFSLEHPKNYGVEVIAEKDGAETIVFQALQADKKQGFQIFITPFEETQLTRERILQDLPGAVLNDLQEAIIGGAAGQNIRALLFWSEDPLIGRTREIWFIHNGYLYEVTAYANMDNLLAGIMSTLAF